MAYPVAMPRGLGKWQFLGCLAFVLAVFFFWNGPVWRHPWNVDASAFASYAPIPLLVLGCLLWSRRFSWRWLFLDTLALTAAKFSITYVAATAIWAVSEPPAKPQWHQPTYAQPSAPEAAPAPTPIRPDQTATVTGVVTDGSGAPVAGVLVYVASGLERYDFAAPTAPVRLQASAAGIRPAIAAVQTYQPLEIRSTDGSLHTITAIDGDGERVFNRAAPGDGTAAVVVLRQEEGVVAVRCRLHAAAGSESPATLGVFHHPFFAFTDAAGRFRFDGVPAGELVIAAGGAERAIAPAPGGSAEVALTLQFDSRP